ncbi:MAG: DUF4215 domain-containing protein, partial [Myxococcales bacterium]|nr:DUF4215 domain-containing protein [Myxococcales bacterium]
MLFSLLVTSPAFAVQDGPDAGRHVLSDNIAPFLFNYHDISSTGTVVASGDDAAGTINFPAGATLNIYGTPYTSLRASTNGYLSGNLAESGGDFGNDCPLPSGSAPAADRMLLVHDDLVSTVYYQHFPNGQSIGWANNTSIIQWKGTYYTTSPPGAPVDFQLVIFHDLDTSLLLVQTADGGGSSTTGMQNAGATTGIQYACNTPGSLVSGATMVAFGTLGLNEIRIDQPGADNDEFIELNGVPGWDLTGSSVVVIGDGTGGSGVIEETIDLNGLSIWDFGIVYFYVVETTYTIDNFEDLRRPLNFENGDNVTFMLVEGFTGAIGDDLDGDDNGTLDVTPWTSIVDEVSLLQQPNPPTTTEWAYSSITVGPENGAVPFHVQRCPTNTGTWVTASPDIPANGGDDTGGLANYCPVCGNGILEAGEACDDGGESATCNSDCTLAACGDGVLNATAGETCDDGNMSNGDSCPDDAANGGTCITATCGDGFVDSNSEDCDDSGESATCDADCTSVVCGDGTLNTTAGEGCDDGDLNNGDACPDDAANGGTCQPATCGDGFYDMETMVEECDGDGLGTPGETATCDTDCTLAVCGDMTVNNTAGETCDDGMQTMTCNSNCTSATCGDGIVNTDNGEECDGDGLGTPGETATCDTDCTNALCGDTVVNTSAGEDCDDGMESATCDADCSTASCGDGTLNPTAGEACDDGNTDNGDGCDDMCRNEMCGDGVTQGLEECDDGNMVDTDDCTNLCAAAVCGDMLVWDMNEECDDG